MLVSRHFLILGITILLGSACSKQVAKEVYDEEKVIESGVIKEFQYSQEYASIVELAEAGDEKSISTLMRYYSNLPSTDLRNLEYWSIKASRLWGREEMTNLIYILAFHSECERAWKVFDDSYPDRTEFPFYEIEGTDETINGWCGRPHNSG